jgi:uncharacterized protein YhhL (DUF1145 family)
MPSVAALKAAVGALWLLALASFFVAPASAASGYGRGLFWLLVVVHALECAIFLPRLRAAGGSLASHLAQTFVFGVAHVRSLPRRA